MSAIQCPGLAHIYDNLTKDVLKTMSHFDSIQDQLRPVLDMLSNPFYRDRLAETCFKGTVFHKLMSTWPAGHFIAWRWNSLSECVAALLSRKGALLEQWNATKLLGCCTCYVIVNLVSPPQFARLNYTQPETKVQLWWVVEFYTPSPLKGRSTCGRGSNKDD